MTFDPITERQESAVSGLPPATWAHIAQIFEKLIESGSPFTVPPTTTTTYAGEPVRCLWWEIAQSDRDILDAHYAAHKGALGALPTRARRRIERIGSAYNTDQRRLVAIWRKRRTA